MDHWRRWRWTILALALALFGTTGLYQTRGWIWLGVPPIGAQRPPFSDAAAQLVAGDVCASGAGQWISGACFLPSIDAETHSQTYEPWLSFQRRGLTASLYVPVAFALIGLFYFAFCLAFRPIGVGEAALLLVLLFSAAVQLAVERANFDLLTSALLCLAAWCLADRRPAMAAAGCLALGFSTSLKIYTLLSCAFAWLAVRARRLFVALFAIASCAGAVATIGIDTIRVLGHGAPEGRTRFSTGAHWLAHQYGWPCAVAACALSLVAAVIAWCALRKHPLALATLYPRRSALMQIAFLAAVPLFLLKDSYDYRFVLWLPCLALPMALLRQRELATPWRAFCIGLFALAIFVFCAELPCAWLDRLPWRDSAWSRHLIEAIVLAKQFATWLLAGLLGVLFASSIAPTRWIGQPIAQRS